MKFLFFAFISFITISAYAQFKPTDYKLTWGDEQKQTGNTSLGDIIDSNENGFVVLKAKASRKMIATSVNDMFNVNYTLEHYTPALKKDKEAYLDLDRFDKNAELLQVVKLKDKLYIFVSVLNKQNKDNELWLGSADYNTLKMDVAKTKLMTLNYDDYTKNNSGTFQIKTSRDDTKLIVYYRKPAYKDQKAEIGFQVYDDNMKMIYQKNQRLAYEEDLLDLEKMLVDNEGNAYSLFKIFNEKRKEEKAGEANYYYLMSSFQQQGEQVKDYKITLPNLFITDMSFTVDDEGQIICSGFYSKEGTLHYQGTYYQRIDTGSGEVLKTSKKPFDAGFVMENLSGREARKNTRKARKGEEMGLSNFKMGDLVLREDGGCVLVAEQYEEIWITSTDSRYSSYMLYKYNDIIVVNINPDGEIGWSKKFPKRQVARGNSLSFVSYSLAVVNDKIALMYNDHKDNLNIGPNDKPEQILNQKSVITVLSIISVNGEEKKHSLFSLKEAGKIFARPVQSEQIDDYTLIIYCERGKNERFAKLQL